MNNVNLAIAEESQDRFAFTWKGRQWTFQILSQEYILHLPAFCHNLVTRDMANWNKLSTIKMYHYINYLMLTYDSRLTSGIRGDSNLTNCPFTRKRVGYKAVENTKTRAIRNLPL